MFEYLTIPNLKVRLHVSLVNEGVLVLFKCAVHDSH